MENIKEQFARLYMELDLTDDQAAMIYKLQKDVNATLGSAHVSKSVAIEYSEFCVRCDREKLPLLCLEDYIEQYCCGRC